MGAVNALGYYYMEIALDLKAAAEKFHQSHDAGNGDASHNLGHMFLAGKYPGHRQDRVGMIHKGWSYIKMT